ncbi:VOC family protein [Flavobacterium polysaccharolyticum]|uniref:VOC family protein n=1 Tax=Flavobacterium polysaccharolyticum TaxID=3133148 RepID=A0ABU9NWI7_9FLAO
MKQKIAHIALLVADYDEALSFYVDKLHFDLVEDTALSETKRWVLVAPKGSQEFSLLLAKADGAIQKQSIGNQSGGRVFLFLNTDNFDRDYQNLKDNNIEIVREPKTEDYGKVLVFKDIYGNLWDLIQRNN